MNNQLYLFIDKYDILKNNAFNVENVPATTELAETMHFYFMLLRLKVMVVA